MPASETGSPLLGDNAILGFQNILKEDHGIDMSEEEAAKEAAIFLSLIQQIAMLAEPPRPAPEPRLAPNQKS